MTTSRSSSICACIVLTCELVLWLHPVNDKTCEIRVSMKVTVCACSEYKEHIINLGLDSFSTEIGRNLDGYLSIRTISIQCVHRRPLSGPFQPEARQAGSPPLLLHPYVARWWPLPPLSSGHGCTGTLQTSHDPARQHTAFSIHILSVAVATCRRGYSALVYMEV